jgi:hypothetical protein
VRVRKFCFKVQSILHSDTNYCRLRKTQQVIFHSNPWRRLGEYNRYVMTTYRVFPESHFSEISQGRVQVKRDGTRWRTGGEVKGKLANGVVASTLLNTSEHGVSSITAADAHTSAASSRLNWRPCRFKWTRPFRRKTKCGFCACAITFQTPSNTHVPTQDYSVYNHRPIASDRREREIVQAAVHHSQWAFEALKHWLARIWTKLSMCIDLLHSMAIRFFICVNERTSCRTFFRWLIAT